MTTEPKETGVDAPQDWTVLPLRRLLKKIEQGWSPIADERTAEDHEWAVIKLNAVDAGSFRSEAHKALLTETTPDTRYEVRGGDVLLTRANTPDLVGDACLVRAPRPRLML